MSAAMIEHNRRAVYTALSGVCADRLLLERAFVFWEKNFSAQGVFRVAQYIDDLMSQVGLNQEQRRALSIALYSALNKQDGELAELPAMFRRTRPAAPVTNAAKPAGGARSPQATVLAKVLAGIVDGAARAGKQEDLIATLQDTQSKLTATVQQARAEWLQSQLADSEKFAIRVPGQEHSAVISHVYVALCDAAGPVVADRILARAIEAAEQLAEAVAYPPRSLL